MTAPEHPSVSRLQARFGDALHHHEINAGDQHVVFVDAGRNREVLAWLKDDPAEGYDFLADVTAVDFHPNRQPRFDLVYHLVSPHRRARVRLKVRIDAQESIETLSLLYPGAGWPEREVFDLFGIVFDGHADLRRLMMPDDWEGHPLRKDYPVQLRKDAQTFMPLQVSEEEFRANLERDRHQRSAAKPK